ncbi:MAG: NAD(P)H-dependent oxidoreductase [Acidobacteria bacterium]|nr:NAD(P)H-dependent oxidoreductase [Acidobacteriota bacterium]
MARILAFAGSARAGSVNKKLVRVAARMAREAGAEVTEIDLQDFPLPLYDGDLEEDQGVPGNATRIRDLMRDHDGLLLSCPEYNSSITPLLKNTFDWVSRPADGQPSLIAFRGKVATLLSASPGALGGLRGLVHVRAILGNVGVLVLPSQVAVSQAHKAFSDDGELADEGAAARVEKAVAELVEVVGKLAVASGGS